MRRSGKGDGDDDDDDDDVKSGISSIIIIIVNFTSRNGGLYFWRGNVHSKWAAAAVRTLMLLRRWTETHRSCHR